MRNITLSYKGSEYKQIQKRTARKLFDQGETVYTIPCKANIYSDWINFIELNLGNFCKRDLEICERLNISLFDKKINQLTFLLSSELGSYFNFYIKTEN